MTDTNKPAEKQPGTAAAVPPQIPPAVAKDAVKPAVPAGKPTPPVPPQPVPVKSEPPTPSPGVIAPKPPVPPLPAPTAGPPSAKPPLGMPPAGLPATAEPEKSNRAVWLACLAFVLLAGCDAYLFYERSMAPDPAQIASLQSDLKAAQQRVAALEQRPLPAAPDTARISALENAVKALASKPAPDNTALEQRLATLESRPAPVMPEALKDVQATLDKRIATLESKPVPDVAKDVQTAVAGASAELSAKLATLDGKVQQDLARATSLRTASASLDAGKPIGDVAGANAALKRFATVAPPTEPGLRQSFAGYSAAAEKASQPSGGGKDFGERMWARAQQLVTVRQGDKVLVGAPAAVTLAAARAKLDAGDLAGAVAALNPLDPAAAAAMAPWKQDAQALLDARAALATLATKS